MIDDSTTQERTKRSLKYSFERYLQDKGKGRGGDGGNYRRNAARELERFAEWAAGDRGDDDWIGVVPDDVEAWMETAVDPIESATDHEES